MNNFLESAQKDSEKPASKKEHSMQICDVSKHSNDLLVRNVCMITLWFAAFLRFNELRCTDLYFEKDYVKLSIPHSKPDHYRFGSEILISKRSTSACPINMLIRYMKLANLKTGNNEYLFRAINISKGHCMLIFKDKNISYTRSRECTRELCHSLDEKLTIGLHSLTSGGATTAVNNHVEEMGLKRHGRWKTDFAKDMYIADCLAKRLEVSQSLGM